MCVCLCVCVCAVSAVSLQKEPKERGDLPVLLVSEVGCGRRSWPVGDL